MNCSQELYDAIEHRLKQVGSYSNVTVIVENDGGIVFHNPDTHFRIYHFTNANTNKSIYYTYVLGCQINFSEEQYTKLKAMAYQMSKNNETRIIKHLYESSSNQ